MSDVISKVFDELTAREFHDVLRLRCDVFVVEQQCVYPEVDGRDVEPDTVHHWIEVDGVIAAYLRQLDDGGVTRLGRVVTASGARGSGLAARLVRDVGSNLHGEVVLDAQSHLVEWYEALGYEASGSEFVEDGIPHRPMRRVV